MCKLRRKNIAGFQSQFLLLELLDAIGAVCLLDVDPRVPNGQKMHSVREVLGALSVVLFDQFSLINQGACWTFLDEAVIV